MFGFNIKIARLFDKIRMLNIGFNNLCVFFKGAVLVVFVEHNLL
jgi:hypothetical protein